MGVVLDGASGLRILTSKNVFSKWPPQKPSAAMSDLAPMSVMVEASLKVSLVTGCRVGSMVTLRHTSDSKFAVRFRISLWRRVG